MAYKESIYEFIYRQNGNCHTDVIYNAICINSLLPTDLCDLVTTYCSIDITCSKCKNNMEVVRKYFKTNSTLKYDIWNNESKIKCYYRYSDRCGWEKIWFFVESDNSNNSDNFDNTNKYDKWYIIDFEYFVNIITHGKMLNDIMDKNHEIIDIDEFEAYDDDDGLHYFITQKSYTHIESNNYENVDNISKKCMTHPNSKIYDYKYTDIENRLSDIIIHII
jgi:hypothetical protein